MESCNCVSWNVNGWKKTVELLRTHEDVAKYLKRLQVDILCLQETKTNYGEVENNGKALSVDVEGYESYWCCCEKKENKEKKGYSGVSTYVHKSQRILCCSNNPMDHLHLMSKGIINNMHKIIERTYEGGEGSLSFYIVDEDTKSVVAEVDSNKWIKKKEIVPYVHDMFKEGRVLLTYHENFLVLNVYVPYSSDSERLLYKIRFLHALRAKMIQLRITTGLPLILLGDLNISFRNKDVHYNHNLIDLGKLKQNVFSLSIDNQTKHQMKEAIELIQKTLQDENNIIIKKFQGANSELYLLYIKFNNQLKRVGNSFKSKEEIYFLFSLEEAIVEDDWSHWPHEYYFFLNYSQSIPTRETDKMDSTTNEKKKVEEFFSPHVWNQCYEWLQKNESSIDISREASEHISKNNQILCKYTYQQKTTEYVIKKKNCLYLKYLNDMFVALDIVLSSNILLEIANSVGLSSSPTCCIDFMNQLIKEDHMIDVFSYLYPKYHGKFTCWDMYKQNRVINEGTRIDYILIDSVLFDQYIKPYPFLFESPIPVNDTVKKWLMRSTRIKEENITYEKINSFHMNQEYASCFNRLKKKGSIDLYDQEDNKEKHVEIHKDLYDFQFHLKSPIGLLYTSPVMSDHIGVNCTFIKEKKNEGSEKQKKEIKVCSSDSNISLQYLCTSSDEFHKYLPFFLINSQMFYSHFLSFTNHIHSTKGLCSNIKQAQPHKKVNKITSYFIKKKNIPK